MMLRSIFFFFFCLFCLDVGVRGDSPPQYFMALNVESYSLPSRGYRLTTMEEVYSDEFQNFYLENEGIPSNFKEGAYQSRFACNVYVQEGWLMYPKDDQSRAEMLTVELNGKNNCSVANLQGTSTFITDTDCSEIYTSIPFPPNQTTFPSLISNTFSSTSTCDYSPSSYISNFSLLTLEYTPASQIQVLTELYTATDGINWRDNDDWMEGDPCLNYWWGIGCYFSSVTGWTIDDISLDNNELNGTLPSSISSLTDLTSLDVRGNFLQGSLPPSLPPSLSKLDCSDNELSGTFPAFSTNGTLRCSNNHFTDAVRVIVGEGLDLSNNNFVDLAPFYQVYNHSKSTYTFNMSNNQLTGKLPDYPIFNDKMRVDLRNNFLIGDVTGIGGGTVYLTNNTLNGKFKGDYQYYPTSIYVDSNELHGVIDPAICTRISSSQPGNFSGNNFACPIPWCLPEDTPCSETFDDYWTFSLIFAILVLLLVPLVFFLVMSRLCGITFTLFSFESEASVETRYQGEKLSISGSQLQISGMTSTFLFAYCVLANIFSLVMLVAVGCHSTRPEYGYDHCKLDGQAGMTGFLVMSTLFFWLPICSMVIVTFFGCWCDDAVLCCDLRELGKNRCVTFFAFASFVCLFSWSLLYMLNADCRNVNYYTAHYTPDEACALNFDRLSWIVFVLTGLGFLGAVASILSGRFECLLTYSRAEVEYTQY